MSVVIPTYCRGPVLLETVRRLLAQEPRPSEILLVDQTPTHDKDVEEALAGMEATSTIRRYRMDRPSIPRAMNLGLDKAEGPIVLFLDDDVVPGRGLVAAHLGAHRRIECSVVAGQVLQPGEEPAPSSESYASSGFRSSRSEWIDGIMAGNFSIRRSFGRRIGGFDENFVRAAYRFETEFADRILATGERIWFEPDASIRHLKTERGGTRAYGHHLRTARPGHSVGAYYYLLRSRRRRSLPVAILGRMARSVRTRHHARRPWWIPVTMAAETLGLIWAGALLLKGPRYLGSGGAHS